GNFSREGLDHNELETMLHEFGHVLHGVLSKAEYNPQAGTSVKGDFVEAPSQMFEEWARQYGQGIFYTSQWLYASYDMALSKDPQPALAAWKKLEEATALGHVEGT